jgi:hypothetical protein
LPTKSADWGIASDVDLLIDFDRVIDLDVEIADVFSFLECPGKACTAPRFPKHL